jgi:hypothetical protein
MKTTHSSLESLQELYPVLASLPRPRFTALPTDTEKKISQHASSTSPSGDPTSSPSILLPTLAYITPPLCILYIALLSYIYGCPFIKENLHALAHMTRTSPDSLLAAALLVSSAGLITLGVGFLWADELPAGDETI